MALFSQRRGLKPVKTVMQVESMDHELRVGLWNMLTVHYWDKMPQDYVASHPAMYTFCRRLWHMHFKRRLDDMPQFWSSVLDQIRKSFFTCEWYEVYDFLEFLVTAYPEEEEGLSARFESSCNTVLERELAGYRFVGGRISPITSEEEITEIEEAMARCTPGPVASHIRSALDKLVDRESPDYRNSVKESISAVEALCRLITGAPNTTLGQALKQIDGLVGLHPALEKGFSSIYGYTSAADGIRHALMDQETLEFEDAKFMLVACSAFVNYLRAKASRVGVTL